MIHSPGGDSGWWVQFSPLLCTSSCCLSQGGRRIEKGRVRGRAPPGASALPLGLAARQGDVAQVQDGQRVGLRVEHPVLKRQQLIAREKQI